MLVGIDVLIAGLSVPETPLRRKARLREKLEGAVDCGEAYALVFPLKVSVELLGAQVTFDLEEGIQDELSLSGELKLIFGDIALKDLSFSGSFPHVIPCHDYGRIIRSTFPLVNAKREIEGGYEELLKLRPSGELYILYPLFNDLRHITKVL